MSHSRQERQERPSCRACRILRAELARLQRESEAQAAADAQRCIAMYDHMERLARLNMALTKQRNSVSSSLVVEKPVVVVGWRREDEDPPIVSERVRQLQATIVQQAKEIEWLQRQLKSSVPLLALDGARASRDKQVPDASEESEKDEDEEEEKLTRRRHGLEKLPLTSLHAQLRTRDATIHRLEHRITELTEALDTSRENKRHAIAQYQDITMSQQTQLKKHVARLNEQERTRRAIERELDELKADFLGNGTTESSECGVDEGAPAKLAANSQPGLRQQFGEVSRRPQHFWRREQASISTVHGGSWRVDDVLIAFGVTIPNKQSSAVHVKNAKSLFERSPLSSAVANGHIRVVKILLIAGAFARVGQTALMVASSLGPGGVVNELLAVATDVA